MQRGRPLKELFRLMALIRSFELQVSRLYRAGEIPGFVHTSLGQEAVAAGICSALLPSDYLATTHRGHGHCLAKGMDPQPMMSELFGKATGYCRGKGGSMHVADPACGVLGANAIVGASMPLAVGAGLSSKLLNQGGVTVAFFGEGAVNQGMFHEAINLAALWDLPVIFACENNGYAEFTDSRTMSRRHGAAAKAPAYGVDAFEVDGNDVAAVQAVSLEAVERCLQGRGPIIVEAATWRWQGHYEGDPQPYKSEAEAANWLKRDPLLVTREQLLASGVEGRELDAIEEDAASVIETATVGARAAPFPDLAEAFAHVLVD